MVETRPTSGSSRGPASGSAVSPRPTRRRATWPFRPRGRRSSRPASTPRISTSSSSRPPRPTCSSRRRRRSSPTSSAPRRRGATTSSAGCTGFVYALSQAYGLVATGLSQAALIVGTEVLSKITNWQDRSTCILFGDGAGAAVLRAGRVGRNRRLRAGRRRLGRPRPLRSRRRLARAALAGACSREAASSSR